MAVRPCLGKTFHWLAHASHGFLGQCIRGENESGVQRTGKAQKQLAVVLKAALAQAFGMVVQGTLLQMAQALRMIYRRMDASWFCRLFDWRGAFLWNAVLIGSCCHGSRTFLCDNADRIRNGTLPQKDGLRDLHIEVGTGIWDERFLALDETGAYVGLEVKLLEDWPGSAGVSVCIRESELNREPPIVWLVRV